MNDITPPPIRSDGDDTRRALVEAGRALFASEGFDGASIRAITDRAGTNLGAVTYHFGSKQRLYETVLEEGLRPLADRVVAAGAGEGSVPDRISAIVVAYFEHFRTYSDIPRLMLQEVAAGRRPPEVVAETLRRVMGTVTRLHAEGVKDGTLRPGDPILTALSILAQPIYMTLVAPILSAFAGVDLTDDATRARAVAHATDFVRAGLGVGPTDLAIPEESP